MDFTSSLDIGSSVLENIENAEKNFNTNNKRTESSSKRETICEVIDESPTNKPTKPGKKTKESSRDALTQSRYRRRALRKNKSDSILHTKQQTLNPINVNTNGDHFSDFFKSPIEFDEFTVERIMKEQNIVANLEEVVENKRQRLSNEGACVEVNHAVDMFAESMGLDEHIRFSVKENPLDASSVINIEDSSIDLNEMNISSEMLLEKVVCSEALRELGLSHASEMELQAELPKDRLNLSAQNTNTKEMSFMYANLDVDNLVFDMSSEVDFHPNVVSESSKQAASLVVNKSSSKIPEIKEDLVINVEETSFCGSGSEAKTSEQRTKHEISLLPSKKEILSVLKSENQSFQEGISSVQKDQKHSISNQVIDLDMSKCSGRVLNWSGSSNSEKSPVVIEKVEKAQEVKQTINNTVALKDVAKWGLPETITNEYYNKGIREMFEWQVECLSNPKVLFEHANLVYSAPTSAGKTLVSEMLTIKTVIERRKKALIILPFISVVREKMSYLQDLLTSSGYRVDGFFGGYTPPGGFENINVAICTIEKANSIINKLLEQKKLEDLGILVVDEIHLISDPGRGYILELLLAKVAYVCRKNSIRIQIVAMSATLSNIILLQKWLHAEYFVTNFRPVELQEMIKIGTKIYNNKMELIRELNCDEFNVIGKDQDHIAQLCIETVLIGCSVIVFCPSKDWCETLCIHLAESIMHFIVKLKGPLAEKIGSQIKKAELGETKLQLVNCPAGLDPVLAKTITLGCAFHHAGLTTEERDIIESNFKASILKVLVATSTLSSGVNLPARRVIIRSPLFAGKKMNSLTYKQMIGRAGRTGKDTIGESLLICGETNLKAGKELVCSELLPIRSCLSLESSMPLKRALLEVISSGIATTKDDVRNFLDCTLLHIQNLHDSKLENSRDQHSDSGSHSVDTDTHSNEKNPLSESLNFLVEYEFVRLQMNEETKEMNYMPTRLGMACLSSSLPPNDGLLLFSELQKSRRCFVLEAELHAVYLVTPYSVCYQLNDIDWLLYLDLHEKLSSAMKRVAELVGVKESFLVKAMRGHAKLDYKALQIHKRFYTAMALQELVNEVPLNRVADKYKCSRGLLQSLQQMSSTFAGIVTSFCNSLNWTMLALIVSEFKERLFFGVHRDLIDLMRMPDLNGQKARALFNAGIISLVDLANADCLNVEKILINSVSFDSEKKRDDEDEYDANKRNLVRCLYITGKSGLTIKDIAKMLISGAQQYLQHEMGVVNVKWNNQINNIEDDVNQVRLQGEDNSLSNHNLSLKSSLVNKETKESKENIPPKKENLQYGLLDSSESPAAEIGKTSSPAPSKLMLSTKKSLNIPLRRSPRNHTIKVTSPNQKNSLTANDVNLKVPSKHVETLPNNDETKNKPRVSDLFNDSIINIDTQMAGALDNREIENVTSNEKLKRPYYKNTNLEKDSNDKSVEEIIESQTPKVVNSRSNTTRFGRARLTQKKLLRTTSKKPQKSIEEKQSEVKRNASSSIEISDCASSSLLNNPINLNASHILSTSKTESSSASFKCISIIDMCGDCSLFKKCMTEIFKSKHIGVSVAIQKLPHKRRPVIGANLLINQIQNCEDETDIDFIFDEAFYICGISFCIEANTVLFLNLQNKKDETKISRTEKIQNVIKIFENENFVLRIFDSKEQLKVLKKGLPALDVIKAKIEDPKIGNWLLEPDKELSLKSIVQQYAPECSSIISLAGTYVSNTSLGLNCASSILGKVRSSVEACVSLHVLESQLENLERIANGNLKSFFNDLEMPVQCVLWKMEMTGFPVDESSLGTLSKQILDVMKKLEQKMYQLNGSRFNLSSTSAVARVLGLHRKSNGKFSTVKQILEKIDSPMSYLILNYRKLGATLNKTIQPLIQLAKNGRIHPNSITFTATGRISMHEPNLQNVAKDFIVEINGIEKYSISCRSSFLPTHGRSLISVDFCQLEMRILTHLSQDEILMKIMHSDEDIFRAIASRWNKIPQEEVSEELRNGTKQICYGIIYGMGLRSLAESLKCEIEEATMLVEQFHSAYPGIRLYTNKVIKFAKQNGYVETITGRRRYLPHIKSTEESQRNQAERQALNTTIQGSAADIAKKAIIRTERNLEKYSSRMGFSMKDVDFVLHLHDELIFEVFETKIQKVAKILRKSMENSAQLNVPLRVKLKAGKSWGTLVDL